MPGKKKQEDDFLVDGPGSPISIKKASKLIPPSNEFTVFVDNSQSGFALDDETLVTITVEERKAQAEWWVKYVFNQLPNKDIPGFLFRYLDYLFVSEELKYKNDKEYREAIAEGKFNIETDESFAKVHNLIKYSASNKGVQQAMGLIQLFAGALAGAKKANKSIRIYIEEPETHFHPKQEARIMSVMYKLKDEFGGEELKTKKTK